MGKQTLARKEWENAQIQEALNALRRKKDQQKYAKKNKNAYKKMGGPQILETLAAKPPPEAWVNLPSDWKPKYHTKTKQQLAFLRWLICKYPTPTFLLAVYMDPPQDMILSNKNGDFTAVSVGAYK